MSGQTVESSVKQWGNGLAIRITKAIAKTAGVSEGSAICVHAEFGRIVIEVATKKPTLDDRLAAFDPKRHSGEVMAFRPVGAEVI